jgi:DNA polymerase III subunit epsilon
MLVADLVEIMRRENYVILDTETSGLKKPAEVIQIAIVSHGGATLLDTLVNPVYPIPPAAYNIHGIADATVANAPTWAIVRRQMLGYITGKDVLVFNAKFDRMIIHSSDDNWNLREDYHSIANWFCVMETFAEWNGEIHPYYGSYVWKSLDFAAASFGIENPKAHSALGDCLTTLELCRKLLNVYEMRGEPNEPHETDPEE